MLCIMAINWEIITHVKILLELSSFQIFENLHLVDEIKICNN